MLLDQRANGFDGLVDDRRQFDALLAQLDLAARDAAHVEQVVDQPRPSARPAAPASRTPSSTRLPLAAAEAQHSAGVADRRQRVAQLVGQHRQELVLAAVGFGQVRRQLPQVVLEPLSLGDILADRRKRDGRPSASGSVNTL